MVYPIIDVADPGMYAAKICAVVVVSHMLGMAIYIGWQRRIYRQEASEDSEILRAPWRAKEHKLRQEQGRVTWSASSTKRCRHPKK
jgi:hypothetical protein